MSDWSNIYFALANAETGGEVDPWIRTNARNTPGGSSAFGPVQITRGLIEDMMNRNFLSQESQLFANNVMLPMQKNFLKYGNMPGLTEEQRIFDYGGGGGFNKQEHWDSYQKMANEIIGALMQQTSNDGQPNIDAFLKRWRGQDPEEGYKQRFMKAYKPSHYRKN